MELSKMSYEELEAERQEWMQIKEGYHVDSGKYRESEVEDRIQRIDEAMIRLEESRQ